MSTPPRYHLDPHVLNRAEARGAVDQFAGILLCVVDHFLHGLQAERRVNHEAADAVADARHRDEVLPRVIGRLPQQRQDRYCRRRREQERISIGRSLRGRLDADRARRAAAILDHELLAERLTQRIRPRATYDVARPSRRIRNDQLDGPARPGCGLRARAAADNTARECG